MKISFTDDTLMILFTGWEKVLALRNQIIIPKQSIAGVKWHEHYERSNGVIRIVGTSIPGIISAGIFRGSTTILLYLRGARGLRRRSVNVLSIETHDFPYSEIALSTDQATAERVLHWWRDT